jgi:hypothetical protein
MGRGRLWVVAAGLGALLAAASVSAAPTGTQFQSFQAISVGSSPAAVAVGDVTGDGRNDVVMTTDYNFDAANDFRLWVFAQTSSGQLAAPVSYTTGGSYGHWIDSVAIGDITGDGRNDVVLGVDSVGVQVFPQTAAGSLAAPALYATGDGRLVRLGQLNGDARLDVAAAGWGTNTVSVLLNNGGGGLDAPVVYQAQHAGYDDLEVGDVTGDARDDIVVMSGQLYAVPNVSVLSQLAGGGFSAPATYSVGTNVNTQGIGLGDVTGDGPKDVVVSYGGNRPSARIGVFPQTAAGTLGALIPYASYDIPEPVEVGDVDLDGRADVVTLHGGWNDAGLYRQTTGGVLAPEELYPIPYASHYKTHGLALGDVNGDGSPDIVLADYNNGLVVLRNVDAVPPPPPPSADLGVALTASGPTVKPKKSFWVDTTVRNDGPDASGATLVVDLGGAPTGVKVNSTACTVQSLKVTCTFATLAKGASTAVRISATAPNKGAVTANATVDGPLGDANPANDQTSLSIQVR